MIAADTSVAVPAALPWHAAHRTAADALLRDRPRLVAHAALETYSVLTRLPPPQRLSPSLALGYLRKTFPGSLLTASNDAYDGLVEVAAGARISGGAVYDALIAVTARQAGATLLTLDRRAIRTYVELGAAYRLLA